MRGTIKTHAPAEPAHRLAVAVVAAVVGILAVGDALNIIYFPMYQLGLPDTALANSVVFLFGVALIAVTYQIASLSIDGTTLGGPGGMPTANGAGVYDERDPAQIVDTRYARGELTEQELEQMRARLGEYDMDDDEEYDAAQDFAENHELNDKQTVIE